MRSRALRIVEFCDQMLSRPEMLAVPCVPESDRAMNRLRAHCKGLTQAARRFLMEHQPDWYALSPADRSRVIVEAFRVPHERAEVERIEALDAEAERARQIKRRYSPKWPNS